MLQIINRKTGISTHTPLARRDGPVRTAYAGESISTHTPLARRDKVVLYNYQFEIDFYSHASREA